MHVCMFALYVRLIQGMRNVARIVVRFVSWIFDVAGIICKRRGKWIDGRGQAGLWKGWDGVDRWQGVGR